MDEERYNNRQIEKMLTDQSKELKDHIDLKLDPIIRSLRSAEDRFSALEGRVERLRAWRTGLTWAGAVIFFIITLCVPLVTWNLLQTIQNKEDLQRQQILQNDDIRQAVNDALDARIKTITK